MIALSVFLVAGAPAEIGVEEMERLIARHAPQKSVALPSEDKIQFKISLDEGAEPVLFTIPGFKTYGCGECHDGPELLQGVAQNLRKTIARLKQIDPEIKNIPLRQFIIQPYADAWLHPRQFAHATFDTVRLFPRTLLIDAKVYDGNTQLHEVMHLTQRFVGHVNELEAYALNARSDPRFLILNYPYFADAVEAYFFEDMPEILRAFFARGTREDYQLPREAQWFMESFNEDSLTRLADATEKMEPLFREVGRLNRERPKEAAFWSAQTGNPAFALELAAVKVLGAPDLNIADELKERAFVIIQNQMFKTDNIRLGYVINRKTEALLTIKHQLKIKDRRTRRALYFNFLKESFLEGDGGFKLKPGDPDDFQMFIEAQVKNIEALLEQEGATEIEIGVGKNWVERIKKELRAYMAGSSLRN